MCMSPSFIHAHILVRRRRGAETVGIARPVFRPCSRGPRPVSRRWALECLMVAFDWNPRKPELWCLLSLCCHCAVVRAVVRAVVGVGRHSDLALGPRPVFRPCSRSSAGIQTLLLRAKAGIPTLRLRANAGIPTLLGVGCRVSDQGFGPDTPRSGAPCRMSDVGTGVWI